MIFAILALGLPYRFAKRTSKRTAWDRKYFIEDITLFISFYILFATLMFLFSSNDILETYIIYFTTTIGESILFGVYYQKVWLDNENDHMNNMYHEEETSSI